MIRSRKTPPSKSSESGTTSPLNSNLFHLNNCHNDVEESLMDVNGKESRMLFESHGKGMRNCGNGILMRSSRGRNELLLLVSLFLASNLTVGLLVYSYMSSGSGLLISSAAFQSCPTTMVEFGNWFANTLDSKRKASFSDIRIAKSSTTKTKSFTPVPAEFYKTFYFDGSKISHPIARALRSRGWSKVDDTDNAHLIYTYSNNADWAEELQPWQRFNYIPGLEKWNGKSQFAYYYKQYEENTETPPSVYVPESYMLTETKTEIEAFRKVLMEGNGRDHPWVHKLSNVNQGRGITIMAPNSQALIELPDTSLEDLKQHRLQQQQQNQKDSEDEESESGSTSEDEDELEESIVQRYICNEMTWNNRKFDVRMYWFVASLDPLVILYHDGYVRVGNAAYSESTFEDTTSHLTSHTGLGAEVKATFAEFEEALHNHHYHNTNSNNNSNSKPKHKGRFPTTAAKTKTSFPKGVDTPVEHVRNQFKHALGEMIEIMKDESFVVPDYDQKHPELSSENAFQFYCADFILDNDLDVWFIEPQNGCGLDEDYYFRLEMHASLFNGMVDVLEEVGRKQEQNLPLLPLEKSGNWELIYADGQLYNYDGYERSKSKEGCKVQTTTAAADPKSKTRTKTKRTSVA